MNYRELKDLLSTTQEETLNYCEGMTKALGRQAKTIIDLQHERDEALADGERIKQRAEREANEHSDTLRALRKLVNDRDEQHQHLVDALTHTQHLLEVERIERRKHQSRADKLAATLSNREPASQQHENGMRAMQDQLQHLSTQLVAVQNDSANYHHLLNLIGAQSMVQAISWIQFHKTEDVNHSRANKHLAGHDFCYDRDQATRK